LDLCDHGRPVRTKRDRPDPAILEKKVGLSLQVGQSLFGILDFGYAGVGVLPQLEEFAVVGLGFSFVPFLLVHFSQAVIIQRVDEATNDALRIELDQPLIGFYRYVKISDLKIGPRYAGPYKWRMIQINNINGIIRT
jgi:hypothetical protein